MFTVYQLNLRQEDVDIAITTARPTVAANASGDAIAAVAITTQPPTLAITASGLMSSNISLVLPRPTIAADSDSVATAAVAITTQPPTMAGNASGAATAACAITTPSPTMVGNASGRATVAGAITTTRPTIAGNASGAATLALSLTLPRPTIVADLISGGEASVAITLPKPTIAASASYSANGSVAITTTRPTIAGNASGRATAAGAITTARPTIAGNASGRATAAGAITTTRPTIAAGTSANNMWVNITLPKPTIALAAAATETVNIGAQNLITQSQSFNTAWTHTNIAITDNNIIAPDGSLTGTLATYSATGSNNGIVQSWSGTGSSTGNTFSIYVKRGSGATDGNGFILRNHTTSINVVQGTFNYDTGVITGTGASAYSVGNGWYRIVLKSATGFNDGDLVRPYIGNDSAAVIGQYFYCWGAQLTKGSFEQTYVKTVGTAISGPPLVTGRPTVGGNASGAATASISMTTGRPTVGASVSEVLVGNINLTTKRPTIAANIDLTETLDINLTTPKPVISAITQDETIYTPVLMTNSINYITGYPLSFTLVLRNSRGIPLNLTGSSFSCKMSSSRLSSVTTTVSTTVIDQINGIVQLHVDTEIMAALKIGRYEFSLIQTTPDTFRTKVAHGIISV